MIDYDILEEYRKELADRYTPLEICELIIDHFDLSEYDVLDLFGDEMIMNLRLR